MTSEDLKTVRNVVSKLGETFENFELHSSSISRILDQWRTLQTSFSDVHKTLESKVRHWELKEVEFGVIANDLENLKKEIELKRENVDHKEMQVNAQCVVVEVKEDALNDRWKVLEVKEKDVVDRLAVLEGKEKDLRDGFRALEEKENGINERSESLRVREKGVEFKEKELKLRECGDLEAKDKVFRDGCVGVEEKENEIDERFARVRVREEEVDKRSRDVDHKEMQVNAHSVVVEVKEEALNDRWKMLEVERKEVDERGKALELKEEEVEELRRGLELKEKRISEVLWGLELKQNRHFKEMEVKEKEISTRYKEMEVKEKQIIRRKKALELGEKRDFGKGFELKEHIADGCGQVLEQNESQLDDLPQVVVELQPEPLKELLVVEELEENHELGAQQRNMELKGKQMKVGDQNSKFNQTKNRLHKKVSKDESGDEQIVELHKVIDLKEKKELHSCNVSESGGSVFTAMDGKALQLYLNERAYKHEFMRGEIVEMLKSMPNPAKIVLDAIDGFFSPDLSKDDIAFEESIVRSSCLLLLEHLMNMKPRLPTSLKKKARAVGLEWRANMLVEGESEDVALAFLLLLVTYKLTTVVNKDELRRLCGIIDHHRLAPCLRQILGLLPKTKGIDCIEDVIKKPIHSDSLQAADALDSLCRIMDNHGVRSYLIAHIKEYGVFHDNILDALRYAPDPAKLVLSVCQISVTDSDQNQTDGTTCIFLLEQLMKLAPSISQEVTKEANKFASFLRARLKRSWNPVDHYRFLQFLVSYKLASSYNQDELLSHFEVLYYGEEVYRPEENAYLCAALGLVKKIPGVIKSLINQQILLSAVQYICVFKLEHIYPPAPLLETHMQHAKAVVDQKRRKGTSKEKIVAEYLESMTLKSILTCISDFKLESVFPPDHFFSARILELEKEKETRLYAKCLRKRNGSPTHQEKRPRVGTVQQSEPLSPVYLPPYPQGPPPRRPLSFGGADYVPNLYFNPPFLEHPRPPEFYGPGLHFNPHGGWHGRMPPVHHGYLTPAAPGEMSPVCASRPIHEVIDQACANPNQSRF